MPDLTVTKFHFLPIIYHKSFLKTQLLWFVSEVVGKRGGEKAGETVGAEAAYIL